MSDHTDEPYTPRACWRSSVDALPSTRSGLVSCENSHELAVRTFHYYLHAIGQATDNVKSLRNSRLRLLERESIKPLQHRFDVFFSKKFLCVFLCYG